jgi:F-box/WD-40 domain protein 7
LYDVYCIKINAKKLYSCSHDKNIIIWNLARRTQLRVLTGHELAVCCMILIDNYLFSGSFDKNILIWDINTYEDSGYLKGHNGGINCLAYSNERRLLFSGSYDYSVRIWDISARKEYGVIKGPSSIVLCLIECDSRLFISYYDGTINYYDLYSLDHLGSLRLNFKRNINMKKLFWTARNDKKTKPAWDIDNLSECLGLKKNSFTAYCFLFHEGCLYIGSGGGMIHEVLL